MKVEKTNYNYS